jgi:exodeoxyribonuclease VII large subunit
VRLCDVRVQGANAPRRVVWALRRFARVADGLDAVVIVRGGGSRSDLAPFDAEGVARQIAAMPIPVFTGIGHEIDRTVADEVAHTSCKTPTACAQSLVERVEAYVGRLDVLSRGIAHRARASCALASRELLSCVRRAHRGAPRAVMRELAVLERHRGRAEELGSRAVREAAGRLDDRRAAAATAATRLGRAEQRRIDALADRLRALDPARVLERGYSITRDASGRTVRRARALRVGEQLVTEFAEGRAHSTVDAVDARDSEPS